MSLVLELNTVECDQARTLRTRIKSCRDNPPIVATVADQRRMAFTVLLLVLLLLL